MKKTYIIKYFDLLLRPFIGTGIGNYFPFRQCISLYSKISKGNHVFSIKETVYGFSMELEAGKLVDEVIIKTGIWEKWVSEIIRKYVNIGDTFIDIWANIGYDSLLASTIVGAEWDVFSFEPSTKNFDRLQRNIILNNFVNIKAFQIWIGDKKETLTIHYNDFNPGESSLVPWFGSTSIPDESVNINALDNLIQNQKVNFIKMDIEWFEPKAFAWMKWILQENKELKIIFEFSPFLYNEEKEMREKIAIDLLVNLRNLWFKLYHIGNHENDLQIQEIFSFEEYCKPFFEWIIKQSDIFCMKVSS